METVFVKKREVRNRDLNRHGSNKKKEREEGLFNMREGIFFDPENVFFGKNVLSTKMSACQLPKT
jgi:hypothetical protein